MYYVTDLQEPGLASVHRRKAFEFSDGVSEAERFRNEMNYYTFVTGEVEKGIKTAHAWALAYPRDPSPPLSFGYMSAYLGRYEDEVKGSVEAIRLMSDTGHAYPNLMEGYIPLNRID